MSTTTALLVAPASPAELVAGARLLRDALGFHAEDGIPPWLMQTAVEHGGVALAARAGEDLVGFSFGMPALDAGGDPFLYSCGLAVDPAHRGRGVGRALKLAQRRAAASLGHAWVRWTADPLNAAALRLYLTGLGATLTGYRAALHDAVRAARRQPQDDVTIEWSVVPRGRTAAGPGFVVELPWDAASLPEARWLACRHDVRAAIRDHLAHDRVGTAVEVDRAARRCFLVFTPRDA